MKKALASYLVVTGGVIILALSLHLFIIPNEIAAGGVTGLAMVVNYYVPYIPVGALMTVMNALLLIIAFLTLGKGFGVKTIYASLGLSGIIWALERLLPMQAPLTEDLLLAGAIGSMMSGLGMGIIFNQGASTGGTDIIAKILNKYFYLDIGKALLIIDFIVIFAASITFGTEKGLYAILAVIANGFIIDYSIAGFNIVMQAFIMTSKVEAVADYILHELGRGVTYFTAQGGYTNSDLKVIYTVLSRKEFIRLRAFIKEVDPRAFITISDAHEVLGEGFKRIDSE